MMPIHQMRHRWNMRLSLYVNKSRNIEPCSVTEKVFMWGLHLNLIQASSNSLMLLSILYICRWKMMLYDRSSMCQMSFLTCKAGCDSSRHKCCSDVQLCFLSGTSLCHLPPNCLKSPTSSRIVGGASSGLESTVVRYIAPGTLSVYNIHPAWSCYECVPTVLLFTEACCLNEASLSYNGASFWYMYHCAHYTCILFISSSFNPFAINRAKDSPHILWIKHQNLLVFSHSFLCGVTCAEMLCIAKTFSHYLQKF